MNPYQSPRCCDRGRYDWTLAKRIAVTVAVIIAGYGIGAMGVSWVSYQKKASVRGVGTLEQLKGFFVDWRRPQQPQ
jgi:hypothetical protein